MLISNPKVVRLATVCQVEAGAGFPLIYQGLTDQQYPFFKVGDMNLPGNEKYMRLFQHSISGETRKKLRAVAFPEGTIVFPKIGAAIGTNKKRVLIRPSCVDNNVMALIPDKVLLTDYLYYLLLNKDLNEFANTGNPPSIRQTTIEDWRIPLPPLPEQRRIADILARADRLRRLRRTARRLGETYLQSVFVEMFGEPERNPKAWDIVSLGDKMTFMTSGSRGWAEYYSEKGTLFLRVQNLGANRLLLDDVAFVQPPDTAESRRTRVKSGDLLISATADLGRTGVIPDNFPEAYINQHLFLIRLKDINPIFVAGYFSTPTGKAQILRLDREGVKSGLNFDDARSLTVFNPPMVEQKSFVAIVQRYERLRLQQREAERQAEMLFQTLLHKSVKGEVQ